MCWACSLLAQEPHSRRPAPHRLTRRLSCWRSPPLLCCAAVLVCWRAAGPTDLQADWEVICKLSWEEQLRIALHGTTCSSKAMTSTQDMGEVGPASARPQGTHPNHTQARGVQVNPTQNRHLPPFPPNRLHGQLRHSMQTAAPGTLPSSMTCSLDTTCPSFRDFCAKLMTVLGASRPANCNSSSSNSSVTHGEACGTVVSTRAAFTHMAYRHAANCRRPHCSQPADSAAATHSRSPWLSMPLLRHQQTDPAAPDARRGCYDRHAHLDGRERCCMSLQRLALLLLH